MIKIGKREIGRESPPFVIAEMSGNHNQSLDRALEIVAAAADAGAHALKIQTYTADTMTLDLDKEEFRIEDPSSLWAGSSLYDLYAKAHTPWEWHKPIFQLANDLGMLAFSTPFDESAVQFLEGLEVPCYKIASFEITDLPLITRVAQTGKPMILSTGMATIEEIREAVDSARSAGAGEIILLKCTSTYPASPENTNVATIPDVRDTFGVEVGLSDHTMGIGTAVAAVALGATVVEKHFTLRRADGGVDSAFSMEPAEFKTLVDETFRAWQALGSICYGPTDQEKQSLRFRRSLYVAEDMTAGEEFSRTNLRIVRPGLGLAPKFYSDIIGKKVAQSAKKGTPLTWDLVVD